MDEILLTPAALLNLLIQIDELNEYDVGITEELNGDIQLTIGNSVYSISNDKTVEIPVDNYVVNNISDININTYETLSDQCNVDLVPVESGVIKEIAKSLLVGGLVRLTNKLLK